MSFLFVFSRHERRTPERGAHEIYEARCIPGNLIGVGRTQLEARQGLVGLLKWTRAEESSFEDWYRESWTRACLDDLLRFRERQAELVEL
ncbi:MAG TPA: hypothetical protein VMS76_15885 [Planctomycetota bacterium]|nr:hypothetical protein [Planctomycetota bacterium]